jgi:hypothetical protein
MEIVDRVAFLEKFENRMFYVGFLKSAQAWFPFCLVSEPQMKRTLDTLPLATTYVDIHQTMQSYVRQIPHVEQTFVQYLTQKEILDLLEQYGLKHVALNTSEGDPMGCGCGCGCA